jgi:hypothetical protein
MASYNRRQCWSHKLPEWMSHILFNLWEERHPDKGLLPSRSRKRGAGHSIGTFGVIWRHQDDWSYVKISIGARWFNIGAISLLDKQTVVSWCRSQGWISVHRFYTAILADGTEKGIYENFTDSMKIADLTSTVIVLVFSDIDITWLSGWTYFGTWDPDSFWTIDPCSYQ